MNRLRRLPALIIYLGVLNFLLFFVVILLLGGSGTAHIEAGRYYLGGAEVPLPIYLVGWIHGIIVFVSWPFVMLAVIVSWVFDASDRYDEAMRVINLGSAYGLLEGLLSRLFDSWRKPNLEFFTQLTESDCITKLITMPTWMARNSPGKKPLDFIWGGHQFELSRRDWASIVVLHGRFHSTPQGTYIKAWYRLSTASLLFLSAFVAVALSIPMAGLTRLIAKAYEVSQSGTDEFFAPIWLRVAVIIVLLVLISISAQWGRHRRRELAKLVKEALATDS